MASLQSVLSVMTNNPPSVGYAYIGRKPGSAIASSDQRKLTDVLPAVAASIGMEPHFGRFIQGTPAQSKPQGPGRFFAGIGE
jgi:hypothetical protein